jgi:hypothetical protein
MIKAKSAKAKGRKLEQWIVKQFEALGLTARRQPGSGAFDAFPHDVEARLKDGHPVLVEAKQRKKDAWATGERWIGSADILVVRIDPEPGKQLNEPRVYMKWSTFERLVR